MHLPPRTSEYLVTCNQRDNRDLRRDAEVDIAQFTVPFYCGIR